MPFTAIAHATKKIKTIYIHCLVQSHHSHCGRMYLVKGPNRERITFDPHATDVIVSSLCRSHRAAYVQTFLEFGNGLYIPLILDSEIDFAARLLMLYNEQHYNIDDDHWTKESLEMESATQAHLDESSSSCDSDDPALYEDDNCH